MSAVSSRPVITMLIGAAVLGCARTAAEFLTTTGRAASNVSREAVRLAQRPLDAALLEIPALPIVREQANTLEDRFFRRMSATANADELSARKAAAIAAISESAFVAMEPTAIKAAVSRLEDARTASQFDRARKDLRKVVEKGHAEIWMGGLRDACTRAFEKTGFRPLDIVVRSPLDIVVSAVNRDGKVMVSELSVDRQGAPRLQTEVVNGGGAGCDQLLESFDRAMEEEIRGAAPVRKKTGGVCQLDAAKAFIARKVRRAGVRKEDADTQRRRQASATATVKRN